jgi:hypothetical protein
MSSAPSVLVLDDGELDHVHRMLKRIGADYVRLQKGEIRGTLEKPRDLLVSSRNRTLDMPRLESPEEAPADPVWVCVHNQDFLPLRQRLRELGVHFLVHTALDQESLRLFLLQILRRDIDRRGQVRLPLSESVQWRSPEFGLEPAKLTELSSDVCRIVSARPAEPGAETSILLPAALGGVERLELQGRVVRCSECEPLSGGRAFSIVVQLDELEPEARAQVGRLVSGRQIGTRVTPLAERLPEDPEAQTSEEQVVDSPVSEPQAAEPPAPEPPAPQASQPAPPQVAEPPVRRAPRPKGSLPPVRRAPRPQGSLPPVRRAPKPQAPGLSEDAQEPLALTEDAEVERRRSPRWDYAGQVDIVDFDDSGASQTALGRDLSFRGVRIVGHAGLEVGSDVTIALYGGRREEPVVIEATVVRDDGEDGMALAFKPVSTSQGRAIEKLIAGLPPVEFLCDGDKEQDGVVIAKVTPAAK